MLDGMVGFWNIILPWKFKDEDLSEKSSKNMKIFPWTKAEADSIFIPISVKLSVWRWVYLNIYSVYSV